MMSATVYKKNESLAGELTRGGHRVVGRGEKVRTKRVLVRHRRDDHTWIVGLKDGEQPEKVGEPTEDRDVGAREVRLGGGLQGEERMVSGCSWFGTELELRGRYDALEL